MKTVIITLEVQTDLRVRDLNRRNLNLTFVDSANAYMPPKVLDIKQVKAQVAQSAKAIKK